MPITPRPPGSKGVWSSSLRSTLNRLDRSRLVKSALWLGGSSLLLPFGLGFWAVTQLSGLPDLPKCFTVSWVDSNPSTRLYCAKEMADRQSPPALQQAIRLVSGIPRENPLREEADRLIQGWTDDILSLGEAAYQNGNLEGAIEIASRIPSDVRTRQQADARISQWKKTWDDAENLYQEAQTRLRTKEWYGVLAAARKLLVSGNRYWATTQHRDLMRQFQIAKDEQQEQRKQVRAVQSKPAQDYLTRFSQEQSAEASAHLRKARSLASDGTLAGMQAAVEEAQQIIFGAEGYEAAQQDMSEWRRQIELIEDRPALDRARGLANRGDLESLQAAIASASEVGWGRALYDEASSEIDRWRNQVSQLQSEARARQLDQMTRDYQPVPAGLPSIPAGLPVSLPAAAPPEPDGAASPNSAVQSPRP